MPALLPFASVVLPALPARRVSEPVVYSTHAQYSTGVAMPFIKFLDPPRGPKCEYCGLRDPIVNAVRCAGCGAPLP